MPGEGGRQEQPGIGHQAVIVKGDADTVGIVLWQHLLSAPCFRAGFCSKTIILDSEEHVFALSEGLSHALVRLIGAEESHGRFQRWTKIPSGTFRPLQLKWRISRSLARTCAGLVRWVD